MGVYFHLSRVMKPTEGTLSVLSNQGIKATGNSGRLFESCGDRFVLDFNFSLFHLLPAPYAYSVMQLVNSTTQILKNLTTGLFSKEEKWQSLSKR